MANKCLLCSEEGHQRRNCPRRHAFPDREERDPQARLPATGTTAAEKHSAKEKLPAPPPPPANANNLQSTGLPPMEGTWGSFNPGISEIEYETRRSRSPLDSQSTRSIVSAERQLRLEKTIRGGQRQSEKIREQLKEKSAETKIEYLRVSIRQTIAKISLKRTDPLIHQLPRAIRACM